MHLSVRCVMPGLQTHSSAVHQRSPGRPPRCARRLPIGAEYLRRWPRLHVRVWAPRVTRGSPSSSTRDASTASTAKRRTPATSAATSTASPATRYRFRLDGDEKLLSRSGVALSAGRPARSIGDRRSVGAFAGPTRRGEACCSKARSSTSCTSARSPATGTWAAAASELPELARVGITLIEVMPVAEFEGRFGWGYDGVDLFAPTHLYGAPDDFRRFVDAAHGVRHRRHPRRRLQPSRTGRQLPARVLARILHRPVRQRVGRRAQLRRRGLGAGARVLRHATPATGSTSSISTACGSTRRSRSSISRRSICWRRSAGARGRRPAGRRIVIVAENEPQDTRLVRPIDRGRLRARRAVERRLSSQRDGRAHRPGRGVLHRHARRAAGVRLGAEVRVSVSGAVLPLAARRPRARPPCTSRRRCVRRRSCRTTIRSRIRRAACAATR